MHHEDTARLALARGSVRTLGQQELPMLRDHLLRLDRQSRHDRFHGFIDKSFIQRYAAKCAADGTIVIAYIEDGVVRGAAELHPPDQSPGGLPEIAFSVEAEVRRQGVGSVLFRKLIDEARRKGYSSLRITTGADNQAMRALAHKFGANLTFRHGETTGSIEIKPLPRSELPKNELPKSELPKSELPKGGLALVTPLDAARAMVGFNRAYWKMLLRMYGWGRTA